jgi:hypothetical protein
MSAAEPGEGRRRGSSARAIRLGVLACAAALLLPACRQEAPRSPEPRSEARAARPAVSDSPAGPARGVALDTTSGPHRSAAPDTTSTQAPASAASEPRAPARPAPTSPPAARPEAAAGPYVQAYRRAVQRGVDSAPPPDNLEGGIVWHEAYALQGLVDMYQATGDTAYLRRFVSRADRVIEARDDVAKRRDRDGRLRMGWQTADGYTFGAPVELRDDRGRPSLEVQAIHNADNGSVRLQVVRAGSERYTLRITIDGSPPVVRSYAGLTQETVGSRLGRDLTPGDWIRARVLGPAAPEATKQPVRFEPEPAVLSTFHSAFILIPFTRFADEVLRDSARPFIARARRYAAMADTIFRLNRPYWVDRGSYGYYEVEPDAPFWMAGIAAPTNVQSANGLYLLHLARATGDTSARHRAEQLLGLVRRIAKPAPDGTYTFPYLFLEGRTGWGAGTDVPRPEGSIYTSYRGRDVPDDASHGAWTAQFVWSARRAGLGVTEAEMGRWRATAAYMLPGGSGAGPSALRARLPEGEDQGQPGRFDYAAPTWALFAIGGDTALAGRAGRLYGSRYEEAGGAVVQMGWARLARIARGIEREDG